VAKVVRLVAKAVRLAAKVALVARAAGSNDVWHKLERVQGAA